jgi:alkanesulfonate monooxygenase SsuD/methylene tetrahydromethanopterin reductase-like flavin-dependent oxidoreductase (luciferase family)
VTAPGPLGVEGEYYRVRGAPRGPRPAHDIAIWVPAGGPRGRRLVGRKADGWIAAGLIMTDPYREVAEGNAMIDEAAVEAGRDPREIRRLYDSPGTFGPTRRGYLQGPPEQWVDELLPLAIERGVSGFALVSDDPGAIERYGREVAPALREALARERRPAASA